MKKILFLPLFQMPSGHHQVADALMSSIQQSSDEHIICKKIDFLSYWNKPLEKVISTTYLKWIHTMPKTYDWIYHHVMYTPAKKRGAMPHQLLLFEHKMLRMLREEKPNVIVCTHCFPSAIINRLKKRGLIQVPVVNVYTDFFINDIWGKKGIDYHLVSDSSMKKELVARHQIERDQIIITGIPVNEDIRAYFSWRPVLKKHILISGGSIGLGKIKGFLKQIKEDSNYRYTVLCGKNQRLYKELSSWNHPNIRPKGYISTRTEMNHLYEQVDAIVTKPGGITISEALKKRLPIFVHSALPGQEQINLKKLISENLIIQLNEEKPFEEQIASVLENEPEVKGILRKMSYFENHKEKSAYEVVLNLLNENTMLQMQPV
ncbi:MULTISPECIES: MGDG synthase family glycosyltransferase [unclassified Fictibacillus]|uniref:MGDG synthase family glycosyltransferase n=1 Tax=unclassified Fictibacillus TaxID=2644029 RepID=UPI00223C8F5A|nr:MULTISPECIES: galactosyldiacylglycerol synthase [unclassified Fictibacillus]MED2972126.1 galactosyldiacylglycerol synthase [Fictibacillus sp. B-59209]UZJ78262.1 galactosyldiacylglycerol synthase [Fictibacillus sp. KU28468]